MPNLARITLVLCTLPLLAVTGCSGSEPKPVQQTESRLACVGNACDGKETTEIGCDENAQTIDSIKEVKAGDFKGMLELRKANPARCDRIYWAKVTPSPDNIADFEVTLVRNGTRTKVQKSEPGNPALEAFTVVNYADNDDQLSACIRDISSKQETCTPARVPS
jgi:hypothetical protein